MSWLADLEGELEECVEDAGGAAGAAIDRSGLGLLTQLADPSPLGLRQVVHGRLQALLDDADSPLNDQVLMRHYEFAELTCSERQSIVLQQASDWHARFDGYYETLPQCLMAARVPATDWNSVMKGVVERFPHRCCWDGGFSWHWLRRAKVGRCFVC